MIDVDIEGREIGGEQFDFQSIHSCVQTKFFCNAPMAQGLLLDTNVQTRLVPQNPYNL